ncbi:Putative MetA-pathway of phenol degradation [Sphingomonas laterariae]|uniref:Putative MetA-pathway of phenol degradation n=1 Tax=Edaphosphingomonas laterariae TaxID=861865 RepID=A0A239DKC2_9SPHN|nr:transporter [Sphingomonas laterariae]SNS33065.1 Putative MetA-pathway of phenol degradation [Sphingomonas laterariae]
MRRSLSALSLAAALLISAPAQAERDLCPDRPGLGTPACTLDAGRIQVELGLADWAVDRNADSRTDTITASEVLVRFGIAESAEMQLGWTAYGHVHARDRASGAVDRDDGTGDVVLALRRNLAQPDGSGFSIAAQPFATLPVGGQAIGAGDWGAGLLLPISYDLPGDLQLALTPEVDAATDADRHGRHLRYGSAFGLGFAVSDAISGTVEIAAYRDRDPADHVTEALAALSFGWQPTADIQLDAGGNFGLNHTTADAELYLGITKRF